MMLEAQERLAFPVPGSTVAMRRLDSALSSSHWAGIFSLAAAEISPSCPEQCGQLDLSSQGWRQKRIHDAGEDDIVSAAAAADEDKPARDSRAEHREREILQ